MNVNILYIFVIGFSVHINIAKGLTLQCSDGWVKLYERCYMIVPYTYTWTNARDYCKKFGARLAEPSGYTITDALSTEVTKKQIDTYWIGYNRLEQTLPNSQGSWSDGKATNVDVGVWAPFQPNVTSGDCATVVADLTASQINRWYMTSCYHVLPFVCERNPCPDDTFTCSNGNCVSPAQRCNGANDCGDDSDEQGCQYLCWAKQEGSSGVFEVTPDNFYGTLTYCVLTIQTEIGKRIRIKFITVDLEQGLDILEIWDGGPSITTSSYVGRVTGQTAGRYETYISSTNTLLLVFSTDLTLEKDGFSITWSTDFACEILRKEEFSVSEGTKGYTKLLTDRQDVEVCIKECQRSTECWGFQFDISQTVERKCYLITEAPVLSRDSCCDVYINTCPNTAAVNVVDDLPTHPYSLVAETTPRDLYTPLYPFVYVGNYEQTHHITVEGNRLITLQIVSVDLCCSDTISIHDGDGPDSKVLALVDKDYTPSYIISSGRDLYIYMNLQQHWECTGVLMKYYAGCDIIMTEESGRVQSPGFDVNPYPDVMTCSWLIQPSSGESARLTFTDFEIEDNMDFLEIYRGVDAMGEVAHVGIGNTGMDMPSTVISTVGIYLRFNTSAVNRFRGFSAEYSAGCPVIMEPSLVVDPMSSSYHSPDAITISCAEGYLFAGSFHGENEVPLTCQKNGTWSLKNLPFCERQYCGLAPALTNGYIETASGVRGGDIIEYACADGFTLVGEKDVWCYSNSTWGPLPKCVADECSDLTMEIAEASVDVIHGNGVEQGSVVKLSCPRYFELIGPQTVICDQGDWQVRIPTCRPIPCPKQAIWNGYIDGSQTYDLNSTLHVICNPGYAVSGTEINGDGYFQCGVDVPLTCDNVNECSLGLDECENSACVDNDDGYSCDCLDGFIPRTNSTLICDDVNECVVQLNMCEHTCTNLLGSYMCSCNTGYDLYTAVGLNGHDLPALEDGTKPWHAFHLNHSCVLKSCTSLGIVNIVNGKSMTSRKSFFYGDTVEFICDIGHYVQETTQGSMNTTCTAEGVWTVTPACQAAYCDDDNIDAVFPNGSISYEARYTLNCTTSTGRVVLQKQCGYDKETGTYRTVGPDLVCPETMCDEPPVYTGMRPFVILSYAYNATIVFECEEQYVRKGEGPFGNYLVPCGAKGSWEYGSLHCEGGQCPDPGYPANGKTTLSSWKHGGDTVPTVAIGSVATFTCNTPGYFPEPSPNATCRAVGSEAAWDNPVPVCVDRQPPAFVNCPDDMVVDSYSSIHYEHPQATDNTGVKSFRAYPENFRSGMTIDSSQTISYIATDYENNDAWCQFRALVKDDSSPKLTCKLPDPITASESSIKISTDIYLTYDDPGANIVANPSIVVPNYAAIGTNPILTFSGTDPSGNLAVCTSQMRIDAPTCTPETLHVYNGEISCNAVIQGYDCVITCLQGYYFYEDPSLQSVSVTCSMGQDWSRDMPICTARDLAHYQYTVKYKYQIGPTVASTCAPTYLSNLNDQLVQLTTALTSLCDNATQTFDVSPSTTKLATVEIKEITRPPVNKDLILLFPWVVFTDRFDCTFNIYINFQDNDTERELEATITMDLTPNGLTDDTYRGCTEAILGAFRSATRAVWSVEFLDGGPLCAQINIKTYSASTDSADFACTSNAEAVALSGNLHICLACPPGTYSDNLRCVNCTAGTYNSGFYKDACELCPAGTSSLKIGARYRRECYEDCGVHMYSATGKAPCTDCPIDTYFVNNTYCAPCPTQTHTRGRGAISVNECIGICQAGYFSRDGLQPCNLCPRHYHQSRSGSESCSECPSFLITLAEGSNSSIDCVDASALCNPNPCQSGGNCLVVRHDFYCNCSAGFAGRMCETSLSPCDVNPCLNGGQCMAQDLTSYTCTCQEPYSGLNCEEDIDNCPENICQNNGTCIDQNGSYLCACSSHSGFHGDKCQFAQNPCLRFPCENSGICEPQDSYNRICRCRNGFSGIDCEINEDECESNPCINNAACTDGDNMFVCTCPQGYTGLHCHLRNPAAVCDHLACFEGTACIDNYVSNSRHCLCTDGWYYSDQYQTCIINNQYCDNVDCGSDGTCMTYDDGYHTKCHCDPGFAGKQCDLDVNDCVYSPCNHNGTCVDAVNGFTCSCPVAGTGGPVCDDIIDGCNSCIPDNTLSCTDRPQSYTCYCKPGYFGENCQNIVPSCEYFPCKHGGSCTNLNSAERHICICQSSWTGNNCEEELDICLSDEHCLNGGVCISTSDGYVCDCPYNYIGSHCEEPYNLCDRANPCVGGNSSCVDSQFGIQCDCEPGYAGDSCETLLWYCADNTCKNGGTCEVVDSVGVVCACLSGYAGVDCSIDVDECLTTECPENSDCVDGINEATCVCHDGKVGELCQKDTDFSFDFLIQPMRDCTEQFVHPMYTVDTSAFTLLFWARATVLNGASSFISLFGVSESDTSISNWQYRLQVGSASVTFDLSQGQDSQTIPFENYDIGDGFWHMVAVTWSNDDGYMSLYVDGNYDNAVVFGARKRLSSYGYIVLGGENSDDKNPFIGRISRVNLLNERLSEEDIPRYTRHTSSVPNILSDRALQMVFRHTYNSQLAKQSCFPGSFCTDKSFNPSMFPSVSQCPNDTLYIGARISTPVWGLPTFHQTLSSSRVSTAISGETEMVWGCHGIGVAEYSPDGAAAVCTFRLYNKRMECTDLIVPPSVSVDCQTLDHDEGKMCEMSCKSTSEKPTEESPVYYTCSKYGMYDQASRDVRYLLQPCSASVSPRNNLTVHLEYNMTQECDAASSDLHLEIKNSIQEMNMNWYNGFCMTQNAEVDTQCDVVEISVTCMDATAASVDIVFPDLGDKVGSSANPASPQDAFKISYRDWQTFTFQSVAEPIHSAFTFDVIQTCSVGYQLLDDKCVLCGNGFYYDMDTTKCTRCPRGTYRTVYSTTSPRSPCTPCPGSDTTSNPGSPAEGYCHESCYLGNYFDETNGTCEACPVGFFTDLIGSSSCSPCSINRTTQSQARTNEDHCILFSDLYTTTSTTNNPSVASSTEEKLSSGVIAAIVLAALIFITLVLLLLFLAVTKRLPCMKDDKKVAPAGTPLKYVNRYGETNMKYINFRLSDIRDFKTKANDKVPEYTDPEPAVTEAAIPHDGIAVQVPVFMEVLGGTVNKKHTFISTRGTSDAGESDTDHISERPASAFNVSMQSDSGRLTGMFKENGHVGSEPNGGSIVMATTPRKHRRSSRHGRPPADLSIKQIDVPRQLSPIRKIFQAPKVEQTSEYIRPPSPFSRQRAQVTPAQYEDFLTGPTHPDIMAVTPPASQNGSDKILLESDDEDLR